MTKQNLYSNAERRQSTVSLYEDLSHFLEGKPVSAKDVSVPLANSLNSKVELYDLRKALSLAMLGGSGLGSLYSALIGSPMGGMICICGFILAAFGFVATAKKYRGLPEQFANPREIAWSGLELAHVELIQYLEDLRSNAQLVYQDGSVVEDAGENSSWYLALAKSALSDRSKELLRMGEANALLVFRPVRPIVKLDKSTTPVPAPKKMREQDRNWLPDLPITEFQVLIDEFGTFEVRGKLQPWSRQLLELGKQFSDSHQIIDGRKFRSEFLKHLKEGKIRHPNGRPYDAEDLAAVFCVTNNSWPSACRRFLTNKEYRNSVRLQQNEDQHVLPLSGEKSGKIP